MDKVGQKLASRNEIVRKAAERFRKEGIAAVGVRPIMADAGLTHGAFYAHFPARSDLVAAAVDFALEGTYDRLATAAADAGTARALHAIVHAYLRPEHRDHADHGCAAAALAPEMARENEEVRAHFSRGLNRIADLIAANLPPGGSAGERTSRAQAIFAGMIGTIQMMRIASAPADIEMHMLAGREAAIALAERPWR